MPHSYVTFLIRELTGWHPDEGLVDALVLAVFLGALAVSLWLNLHKRPAGSADRRG
jgi:hypothetical protein